MASTRSPVLRINSRISSHLEKGFLTMLLKNMFALLGSRRAVRSVQRRRFARQAHKLPRPPIRFRTSIFRPRSSSVLSGRRAAASIRRTAARWQLLQRNDVRNEIGLDLKQQNALDELRTKSQQEFQTTLRTNIQESMKALQNVPRINSRVRSRIVWTSSRPPFRPFRAIWTNVPKRFYGPNRSHGCMNSICAGAARWR